MKNKDYSNFDSTLKSYLLKTYYKTASLIANSLLGVCEINSIED